MADHDVDQDRPSDLRRVRRGTGERARRRREEDRARRWRTARRLLLGAVVVALLAVVVPLGWRELGPLLAGDDEPVAEASGDDVDEAVDEAGADTRPTALAVTFDDAGEAVTRIQLFSLDAGTGRGAVVLVPTTMVADVPGYGLLPVGDAGAFGGVPLVELTLENQLGVAIDATMQLTEQDWAAVLTRTGGFEVDVARAISAPGSSERRFEPGAQFLDGPRLAELLTVEVDGEDELTSFARVRQVLEGFLGAAGEGGGMDALFEDGAPMLAASDVEVVERVLRGLAGPDVLERVAVRTLPVNVMGSGDGAFYRLDDERADVLVADLLGGDEVDAQTTVADGVQLEILNGNGRVGVGADVAAQLVPLGHTVAITRNAENFDHTRTRVLLHADDDELVAVAQEIVDTLGVGRVEVSDVPSSIVDITVLVGADYRG